MGHYERVMEVVSYICAGLEQTITGSILLRAEGDGLGGSRRSLMNQL